MRARLRFIQDEPKMGEMNPFNMFLGLNYFDHAFWLEILEFWAHLLEQIEMIHWAGTNLAFPKVPVLLSSM